MLYEVITEISSPDSDHRGEAHDESESLIEMELPDDFEPGPLRNNFV